MIWRDHPINSVFVRPMVRLLLSFALATIAVLAFMSYVISYHQAREAIKTRDNAAVANRGRIDQLSHQTSDLQDELDAVLAATTNAERRTVVNETNARHAATTTAHVPRSVTTTAPRVTSTTTTTTPPRPATTTTAPPPSTTTTTTCTVEVGPACIHK